MKKLWQLLIVGSMAGAFPATAFAQSLGINFAADDPSEAESSLLPTEAAGAVAQSNWNNVLGATGSASGLFYDDKGTPVASTVNISWSSVATWRSGANNAFPEGGNRKLMTGYLDAEDTTESGATITVDNIDAALRSPTYDVYVYFLSDNCCGNTANFRGGGYTIDTNEMDPITQYGSVLEAPSAHVLDPGNSIDNTVSGTYLRFSGLTGSSFTLTTDATLTMPNGFRAPVAAIQISAPLLPGDVDGNGVIDITDFHIIRGNFYETGQARAQGDLNGDGIVDFADYREWKLHAPAAAVAASISFLANVPEPTSGLLLTIGAALATVAMRRTKRNTFR